jgi:hypothetical protein
MHSLDQLNDFVEGLRNFVDKTKSSAYINEPNFFRCVAGPWLSRQLLPRPKQDNSCRFIRCFQHSNKDDFVKQIVVPLLGSDPFSSSEVVAAATESIIGRVRQFAPALLRGLELRLTTIYAVHNELTKTRIQALLNAYTKFFGQTSEAWESCQANKRQRTIQTVAYRSLLKHSSKNASAIADVIDQDHASYLDPAVAFLIDTILECSGGSLNRRSFQSEDKHACAQWHPGQTWVMTVVTRAPDQLGIVAKLLVEAVAFAQSESQYPEDTPGAFYPHPHLGTHFRMNQDFQNGIRNAWLATIGCAITKTEKVKHDYRWSLIPYDPDDIDPTRPYTSLDDEIQQRMRLYDDAKGASIRWEKVQDETSRHLYLWYPMSGPSATLPFALAIKSSRQNESIRSDVAATAEFDIRGGIDRINENQVLKEIGGLPHKLEAAEKTGVKHLIVCNAQTAELPLPREVWLPATNLANAYQEATEIEKELERYAVDAAGRWNRIVEAGKPRAGQPSD